MANHIITILHIENAIDEDSDNWEDSHKKMCELYKKLKTDDRDFNFNAIIPQPNNIEKGNCGGEHKEGEVCWYGWNTEHWGTKWNAYDVKYLSDSYDDDKTVYEILVKFVTAWSPPYPILQKLAEDYRVRFTWKDEGSDDWCDWEELKLAHPKPKGVQEK